MFSHSQQPAKITSTKTSSSRGFVESICRASNKKLGVLTSIHLHCVQGIHNSIGTPESHDEECMGQRPLLSEPDTRVLSIPSLVDLESKMYSSSTSTLSLPLSHLNLEGDSAIDSSFPLSHTSSMFCGDHQENGCSNRLDIEITQMDIVRMNRTAASSLGVSSLTQLPIHQYDLPNNQYPIPSMQGMVRPDSNSELSWTRVDQVHGSAQELDQSCAICSSRFVRGEFVRLLPYGRCIHTGCIERCASKASVYNPEQPTPGKLKAKDNQGVIIDNQNLWCSSHSNDSSSDDEIPSWTFVKIGSSLEGDVDETVSLVDSIPSWSFEQVGEAL